MHAQTPNKKSDHHIEFTAAELNEHNYHVWFVNQPNASLKIKITQTYLYIPWNALQGILVINGNNTLKFMKK